VRGPFAALGIGSVRLYLAGSAISLCGTWAQRVAQDFLVLELGGGEVELGALMAAQFVPVVALASLVGTVLDRFDLRRVLLITQSAAGVLATVLAVLVATGTISFPLLLVLSALLGVTSTFDAPARATFLAQLAGDEQYQSAQSLYSIVHNAGRLAGPGIAALTVALAGLPGAFAVNAASFVPIIAVLVLVRAPVAAHEDSHHGPRGGRRFRVIWRMPQVRSVLLGVATVTLLGQNIRVVLPVLVTVALAGSTADYAVLLGAMGAGAIVGALLPATLPRASARQSAVFAFGLSASAVWLGLSADLVWAAAAMVVLGMTSSAFNTGARVQVLTAVDPSMRGSAMSLFELMFHGSVPLGALLLGILSQATSPAVALFAAGGVIGLTAVVIWVKNRVQ
jgi:MFS family permease